MLFFIVWFISSIVVICKIEYNGIKFYKGVVCEVVVFVVSDEVDFDFNLSCWSGNNVKFLFVIMIL